MFSLPLSFYSVLFISLSNACQVVLQDPISSSIRVFVSHGGNPGMILNCGMMLKFWYEVAVLVL